MLQRTLGGVVIFCLGLNLIGLGCEANGSMNRWNPIYGFLQGFFFLERVVFIIAVSVGVLYLVVTNWPEPKKASEHWFPPEPRYVPRSVLDKQIVRIESNRDESFEHKPWVSGSQTESISASRPATRNEEERDQKIKIESPKIEKVVAKNPAPLTREELKRRAISDLTRR